MTLNWKQMSTYELKKEKQTFTARVDYEASEDNNGKTVLTDVSTVVGRPLYFLVTCDA